MLMFPFSRNHLSNMDNDSQYDGSLYRLFYVFMDPEEYVADIPKTFVEWFGNRVSCTVILRDSSKNAFNIRLTKAENSWVFTSGVERLLAHYNLNRGSWVRVFYMGGSEFFVQMMNRDLVAVDSNYTGHRHYQFGWPHAEKELDPYDSDPDDDDWSNMEVSDIYISAINLLKNRKALPSHFVRDAILPSIPSFCVLRDQHKGRFFCEYEFCHNNDEHCALIGGWLDFVASNNLTEHSKVRLGIRSGDPSVIHARVVRRCVGVKIVMEKKVGVKRAREDTWFAQPVVKNIDAAPVDEISVNKV